MYDATTDQRLKETVVSQLVRRSGTTPRSNKLISIVKTETNYNIRRTTISRLSGSDDPRIRQALKDIVSSLISIPGIDRGPSGNRRAFFFPVGDTIRHCTNRNQRDYGGARTPPPNPRHDGHLCPKRWNPRFPPRNRRLSGKTSSTSSHAPSEVFARRENATRGR